MSKRDISRRDLDLVRLRPARRTVLMLLIVATVHLCARVPTVAAAAATEARPARPVATKIAEFDAGNALGPLRSVRTDSILRQRPSWRRWCTSVL